MMDRYVIVQAAYEPDTGKAARSLARLVPELRDAGLTMSADLPNVRTWAGVIDDETYRRLADSWHLEIKADEPNLGMATEYGHLPCHAYTWDGMEWERNGWSPVVWLSLRVSEPVDVDTCPHCGARTHVGGGACQLCGHLLNHPEIGRRYATT
jgi:hypothetical protein